MPVGDLVARTFEEDKMNEQQLYKIIRFFRESNHLSRVIKRNLTLDEAQAHCRNPLTAKEGEWFDGYEAQ